MYFDDEVVLQQIKHTGILQIVHIQKSGYTAKYSFKVCKHGEEWIMSEFILQFIFKKKYLHLKFS